MEACEEFSRRMQVITLTEKYILLIFSGILDQRASLLTYHQRNCQNHEERKEVQNMINKLDDEYRAKLLRAITNARIEKPLDDTQSELDAIAQCISNRIALLQYNSREPVLVHGPLVTEFYKEYYHEAIQYALAPIDIDEIKQHYDEHFPPFRTGPIRPFSCINMKFDDMKLNK